MTQHITEDCNKLKSFFKDGYLFKVDREFRDILEYLDCIQIDSKMFEEIKKS